jgi:hypothetical protein
MMRNIFPWRRTTESNEFEALEAQLAASLREVEPSQQFIEELGQRLMQSQLQPLKPKQKIEPNQRNLLIGAGIASGAIMLVTGAIGLIRYFARRGSGSDSSAVEPQLA